jgi:archaeosine synthase
MDSRTGLYKGISSRKGMGVTIKRNLCFYNPREVYKAVTQEPCVIQWLNFISNHYLPPPNKTILLIFPCSNQKPYHKSRSYRMLSETLATLGRKRSKIHLMTISEPFGLVPEEFYEKKSKWHDWQNDWYDCPGLFKWWCNKHNQPYSQKHVDKTIDHLADCVAEFLLKAKSKNRYSKIIAFVRTYTSGLTIKKDHTHRRIIEKAAEIAKVDVQILPDKRLVSRIVKTRGRMAWDMYGVAHPIAQDYLKRHLKGILDEKRN